MPWTAHHPPHPRKLLRHFQATQEAEDVLNKNEMVDDIRKGRKKWKTTSFFCG
jgi:hypothetical protein